MTFEERAEVFNCVKRRGISRYIVYTNSLLIALQGPLVHLLGLDQLTLVGVEEPQVVDYVKRRRVLRTPCLLVALQSPLVHLLGLDQLALVGVEEPQVMICPVHSIVYNQAI